MRGPTRSRSPRAELGLTAQRIPLPRVRSPAPARGSSFSRIKVTKQRKGAWTLLRFGMTSPSIPRRRALALLGAIPALTACREGGAPSVSAPASASATPRAVCLLTPEQEEGPFYIPDALVRAAIAEGQRGVPLELGIRVVAASTCAPLAGVLVEVWQANAAGLYSGEEREGTSGQTYLRGVQTTDGSGNVRFHSVYPGWYHGRSCHVHVKVRSGGAVVHGGQMFFPAVLNEQLRVVYADNGHPFVKNEEDFVFTGQHGETSVLSISGSLREQVSGSIVVAVNG